MKDLQRSVAAYLDSIEEHILGLRQVDTTQLPPMSAAKALIGLDKVDDQLEKLAMLTGAPDSKDQ